MIRILFVLACCFFAIGLCAQDLMYERSGQAVRARVLEVGLSDVTFKKTEQPDGPVYSRPVADFDSIRFANGSLHVITHPATAVASSTVMPFELPMRLAKNTVFAELLGNGGLYSINYERLFPLQKNNFGIAARVGYAYWGNPNGTAYTFSYQTIPVELSALYGHTHKAELGLGYTPLFMRSGTLLYDVRHVVGLRVGYRFQQPEGGFFFKCGFMMGVYLGRYANEGAFSSSSSTTDMARLMPTTGVSFGYTF